MAKDQTGMANALVKAKRVPQRTLTQLAEAFAKAQQVVSKGKMPKILESTGGDSVLEYQVKRAVKARLNAIGAYHWWPVQTGMGARGLDCIGCYQGKFFAIETKRPGGKPTALQEDTITEIRKAGGEVMVIDSEEAARNLFVEIVKGVK